MKKIINMSLMMALLTVFTVSFIACSKDDDKDMTPPVISDEGIVANPINCQQYHPGDIIYFHYVMTDNEELGNYNIEIHNNFNHHSHSTEADDHDHEMDECDDDDEHEHEHEHSEGKAWVYNQDFTIPAGLRQYDARVDIQIPADIEPGDYHFMIRLTDAAGWQQLHAVAVKILSSN
jgi:hypothetical protein